MCNSMCAGAGAIGRHQSSSKQSLRIDTSPAGGRKCGRGRRLYDCLRGAPGGLSRSTRIMRLPCSGGEPVFTLLLLLLRGGVVVFAGGPGCFTIDLGKAEKAVSFFEKRAHIRICRLALRDQSVPCANNSNSVHMLKFPSDRLPGKGQKCTGPFRCCCPCCLRRSRCTKRDPRRARVTARQAAAPLAR